MAAQQPDLFSLYFDYVAKTEPPVIFHRWSLIACLGAYLGRQVWLPFGAFRVFPNQYLMLIGDPGTRKSTAIKLACKVISKAGYETFAAEKTTKEKFLLDLEGIDEQEDSKVGHDQVMENLFGAGVDGTPKEMFISADEFNDFMRCGDLEFHSMLGALWDWDDEAKQYKQRLKTSRSVAIYQPTISILGGNTHTGFSEMFPPQAIGQGFLSRMLLIFSEPSGIKIAFPEQPSGEKEAKLLEALQNIKAKLSGPMTLTSRAREMLEVLYNTYEGFTDARFTPYFTRRYTHLLKLCILCTAARASMTIGEMDVVMANTILSYTEHFMPKALGEFGKAKNADVANRIIALLQKTLKPLDVPEIWPHVSSDLDRIEELLKIMEGLRTANKVQWIERKSKGGIQGYMLIRKMLGAGNKLYVDFSLLKESEQVKVGGK